MTLVNLYDWLFFRYHGTGRESGETQMSRLSEHVDTLIAAGHPVDEAIQLALDPEPKPLPDDKAA